MTAAALAALLLPAALSAAPSVKDGVIVISDVADPVSLDPHREFDASSDNIVNQLFDGLVRLSSSGAVLPALALSWRRVDAVTMEFALRPGVFFHDGEPFDAEAVRFSLARQLDPARPAPNAGLLANLAGVEVVDPLTVRLKTKEPDGVLLNKLPMFFKVLPPAYLAKVGDEGFARRPVGTGPFEFVGWERGRQVELKANPRYWAGPPALKTLVFRFLPRERQLPLLLSGEADMIADLSGLDTKRVAENPGFRVSKAKGFYTVSLLFNTMRGPFADVRLRQAAAHAVNPHDLTRYGGMGNADRLGTLTIPGQACYDHGPGGYSFDPAAARRLLAAAGVRRPRIKVLIRAEVSNFAKVLLHQLKEAGFDAEAEVGSQETVFRKVVRPNLDPSAAPWEGDLVITHYVDPTAHVYFPYSILVHSKGPYSMVRDEEFDALFETMIRTLEPAPQRELCRSLAELTHRKCLALSALQVIRPVAARRGLRYEPQVTGMLEFRNVSWEDGDDDDD
ncbi:MAG: ABC transporter substrate-binding protein [Elusimicrobia bacterium]|nr:ABC transporter substrate-binding protein [Elusimicrobiota bacterium]